MLEGSLGAMLEGMNPLQKGVWYEHRPKDGPLRNQKDGQRKVPEARGARDLKRSPGV